MSSKAATVSLILQCVIFPGSGHVVHSIKKKRIIFPLMAVVLLIIILREAVTFVKFESKSELPAFFYFKAGILLYCYLSLWLYAIFDMLNLKFPEKIGEKVLNKLISIFVLLPFAVYIGVLVYLLVQSFSLSYFQYDSVTPNVYVGLKNFKHLVNDPLLLKYFKNDLVFTLMFFVLSVLFFNFFFVITKNEVSKKHDFIWYFIIFLYITPFLALSTRWILNPDFGLINTLLRFSGISNPPSWLMSTSWAKPGLIIGIFQMFSIGLLGLFVVIRRSLIRGHNSGGISLNKKLFILLLISMPFLLKYFSVSFQTSFMVTQGGPAGSTTSVFYYIYNNCYQWFKFGYAQAINTFNLIGPLFFLFLLLVVFSKYEIYITVSNLNQSRSNEKSKHWSWLILFLLLVNVIFITYWMFQTSVKDTRDIYSFPPSILPNKTEYTIYKAREYNIKKFNIGNEKIKGIELESHIVENSAVIHTILQRLKKDDRIVYEVFILNNAYNMQFNIPDIDVSFSSLLKSPGGKIFEKDETEKKNWHYVYASNLIPTGKTILFFRKTVKTYFITNVKGMKDNIEVAIKAETKSAYSPVGAPFVLEKKIETARDSAMFQINGKLYCITTVTNIRNDGSQEILIAAVLERKEICPPARVSTILEVIPKNKKISRVMYLDLEYNELSGNEEVITYDEDELLSTQDCAMDINGKETPLYSLTSKPKENFAILKTENQKYSPGKRVFSNVITEKVRKVKGLNNQNHWESVKCYSDIQTFALDLDIFRFYLERSGVKVIHFWRQVSRTMVSAVVTVLLAFLVSCVLTFLNQFNRSIRPAFLFCSLVLIFIIEPYTHITEFIFFKHFFYYGSDIGQYAFAGLKFGLAFLFFYFIINIQSYFHCNVGEIKNKVSVIDLIRGNRNSILFVFTVIFYLVWNDFFQQFIFIPQSQMAINVEIAFIQDLFSDVSLISGVSLLYFIFSLVTFTPFIILSYNLFVKRMAIHVEKKSKDY